MTVPRTYFLHDVPVEDARARFAAALAAHPPRAVRSEVLGLEDARDRVTAEPVRARLSSPHYHACAMDGIAVRAAATAGATATRPLTLNLGSDAIEVDTGDPLPPACDAVIPIEAVEPQPGGTTVAIRAAVAPFEHVRAIGEDIVATEIVVPAGRCLGPADLAACAAAGITRVRVLARPRIALITTGDELVDASAPAPAPGEIVDSNAVLLAASVASYGGVVVGRERLADDPALLQAAIERALDGADVVVVNAGSSAGRDDHTAATFGAFGDVVVHGVAIRPGHPLVLAVTHAGVPLVGIPGYPVSAAICSELFLRPLLESLGGRDAAEPRELEVELARKLYSPLGEDEYVRAVAARVDGRVVAVPLRRGAGIITSLSRANCLLTIPRFSEGARAGTRVTARLLRPLAAVERTVLAVGSHDVALDLLAGRLAGTRGGVPIELVSAHVGSIAGLTALRDRSAHVAGTHVLDAASGTYNDAAVRSYGPREPVALVRLAEREQGLLVASGNPRGVTGIADITQLRFVNRQKDAGTRILFDVLLARAGLDPGTIDGYDRIEFSHLAAAQLVANGSADAALGIRAAAAAFGLGFVPIAWEPYELAILASALEEPRIARLIAELGAPGFRKDVEALGGYDAAHAGEVRIAAAESALS